MVLSSLRCSNAGSYGSWVISFVAHPKIMSVGPGTRRLLNTR